MIKKIQLRELPLMKLESSNSIKNLTTKRTIHKMRVVNLTDHTKTPAIKEKKHQLKEWKKVALK